MQPLPYTEAGARIAFCVVVGVFALLELRIRVRSGLNRQGIKLDRASLFVVVGSVYAGVVGGFVLARTVPAAAIWGGRWPVFVAGLVVIVAGVVIRQWAVAMLGKFFTVEVRVHPDQAVVERGPYRWVRHPSYTGMLLSFTGIGLALGNWASLAVLAVVPAVGLIVRIRVEERVLLDNLGEPYRRFAAGRKRLLPRVW